MERVAEPQAGFCAHRSTGRNCPISKTPCLGECVYANILEDIQLGIVGVDRSRKEIFFQNKLALELFGKTIRPRDFEALSALLFADVDEREAKSSRKIRFGARFLGCTIYRISDAYFWIYVSDITEKERLAAVAEAVNTMNNLGYVVSGIRHELGNPINSIKTAVMVLRDNVHAYPADAAAEFLDRVLSDVARVEKLLHDLKTFTPYEAPEARDVDMNVFLDGLLSLVSTDLASRGIRLRASVRPEAQWARADPRALQHVMLNVVTNAIDAVAGRASPRLAVGVARSGDRIAITVEDNGCGIPEDFRPHLFKPFFTTKAHGTGLGLVISRNMMAKMGGTIEVASREGAGTTFTLDLPAGAAPATRPSAPAARAEAPWPT